MMKHNEIRNLVLTALFVALILLFGLTPVGLIPLGFINISLLGVPVVIGTLLMGLAPGMILGLSFGGVSALSAFGLYGKPSLLAGDLVAANPILAAIMCFLPRLLIPVVTHFVYQLVSRKRPEIKQAVPVAAAAGSLTNTILYLGLMFLFYVLVGKNTREVLAFIGGTGIIAGPTEAVANAIISTAVLSALWGINKKKSPKE